MHNLRLNKPRTTFKLKNDENEGYYYFDQGSIKNNVIIDINMDFHILHDTKLEDESKITLEDTFLKEIRFFSVDEQFDTITLSSKMLMDENWFKDLMNTFSKTQSFKNFSK